MVAGDKTIMKSVVRVSGVRTGCHITTNCCAVVYLVRAVVYLVWAVVSGSGMGIECSLLLVTS